MVYHGLSHQVNDNIPLSAVDHIFIFIPLTGSAYAIRAAVSRLEHILEPLNGFGQGTVITIVQWGIG